MRLLHTSDWHLGMQAGTESEAENQEFFFEQLYDIIRDERVDAVLLAGDVYDSGVSNAAAIEMYNEVTTTICRRLAKPLVIIAGNHDSPARLETCRELLSAAGLYVFGRLARDATPVVFEGGKVAVYPIPYFNRDEAIYLFPERAAEIRSQERAMMVVCDHIRSAMDPAARNIVLSHALIVNAELSESDRSARVGLATAVSKDVFAGFDYAALGHIHKPQSLSDSVCYSGSPVKYSFGEERQQKSVIVLDTDGMEKKRVPIEMKRDRKTVEGRYAQIVDRTDLREDFLRLILSDRYIGPELFSELRQRFPHLLEARGMSLAQNETLSALSVDELERMDDTDIMKKFLLENFSYEPTEEQLRLFSEVLKWSEEEAFEA